MSPSNSPDRFVADRRALLVVVIGLAAVCLLIAWAVWAELQKWGDEPDGIIVLPYAVGGAFGLVGLWALARIPTVLSRRFEIGHDGVRWRTVHLPWDQVQAVRILVLSTANPPDGSMLVGSPRSSARVSLEVSMRGPGYAERLQPALASHRIPGVETEGYTHHFPLGPGPIVTSTDPAKFAPQIQAILARVAAPIYYGVFIRATTTAWTRS